MVRLNSGLPEFSNIICPSRLQPTWKDQTRNFEIPGSTLARRPGMTFQSLSKTQLPARRQVTICFRAPHCSPHRPMLHCALPARALPGAGSCRVQAGVFMHSPDPPVVTEQPSVSRNRLVLIVYTSAIFVSALLLFSVQPLFTKMVLPRLGGSPAVWSVAMVFFQSLLLGGYAYAHYLMQIRNRMVPIAVHLALLVVALLTLPLSIASGWGEPPTSGYAFWLLGLFAVSIGLPFFALAANNPLLQAWFVRTGHPAGPGPYFLYAFSNIGSFLALLSYPVLLEPMFTLRTQNLIWTGGYGLLIVLIVFCGVLLLRPPPNAAGGNKTDDSHAPAPSWRAGPARVFFPPGASGLLIAVAAPISTDVAAPPLLWVLPLSLYLLTCDPV